MKRTTKKVTKKTTKAKKATKKTTPKKTAKRREKVSPLPLPQVNHQREREINDAYHAYMAQHPDPWERAKYDAAMGGYDACGAEAYCLYKNYTM